MNTEDTLLDDLPLSVRMDPQALQARHDAKQMLQVALSYEIDSPEMLDAAASELRSVVARKKAITEKRMDITRPLDAAKRAVMDFFAGPLDLLDQAEKALKGGMITYERKERERIAAEQRAADQRAAAERADALRREREAEEASRAAAESGNDELALSLAMDAEDAREQADLALVAPPLSAVAAPKAAGASFRGTWKGRLTDKAKLIAAASQRPELQGLLAIDTTALNAMARAVKDSATVPGVEFYEERGVAARGAR